MRCKLGKANTVEYDAGQQKKKFFREEISRGQRKMILVSCRDKREIQISRKPNAFGAADGLQLQIYLRIPAKKRKKHFCRRSTA